MHYQPKVELVLASKNIVTGVTLWTFKIDMPKSYLAQLNTHRILSRNASSSRAVPVEKLIERIKSNTVIPMEWVKNQPGMSGDSVISLKRQALAEELWLKSLEAQLVVVKQLKDLGLHKQYANRILEPYMNAEVLLSGTQWNNFIQLRKEHSAQPELQAIATQIEEIQNTTTPTVLNVGDWHLPFITSAEKDLPLYTKQQISVARCARVSYYLKDTCELSNLEKDIKLFEQLKSSGHWSPFEMVATPYIKTKMCGNYLSWVQLRHQSSDNHGDIDNDLEYATRQELKEFFHGLHIPLS